MNPSLVQERPNFEQLATASLPFATVLQGLKKVPSGRPGQADFLLRQVTFKFACSMGKGLRKSSSLTQRKAGRGPRQEKSESCLPKSFFRVLCPYKKYVTIARSFFSTFLLLVIQLGFYTSKFSSECRMILLSTILL